MRRSIAADLSVPEPGFSQLCIDCDSCSTRHVCHAVDLQTDLPDTNYQHLFHSHVMAPGKHLFHAGEKLDTLYVIKSGTFKTYLTNEFGDESVRGFSISGEVLGADALADYRHEYSAVSLVTSAVCAVSIKKLEGALKCHSSNWLLKQACFGATHESINFLISIRNTTSAHAKIAIFLLTLAGQHKIRGHSEKVFRLDMPRHDIANYLGLTIETVSRVLGQLHETQVVNIHGRDVVIINLDELKNISQSCRRSINPIKTDNHE